MKYNFTFSLALFLCFSITLLAQDKDYTITASIKKYPSDAMAYLQYKGLKGQILDSVTIENGSFTFKGKIDEPRPARIIIREPGEKATSQHMTTFYIEPGDLAIKGNMLVNASITGSPATVDKKEFDKLLLAIHNYGQPQKIAVRSEVVSVPAGSVPPGAITQGRGSSSPGGTVISSRRITDINEMPYEVQSAIKSMREEEKVKVLKFIKDHPNSFVSMYTLSSLWAAMRITYVEYITLLDNFGPNLVESNEGKVILVR